MKKIKDMTGIEAIERLILICDKATREEIAAKFGGELAILSLEAKEKMQNITPPTEDDEKGNTNYWQAYLACQ